MPYLFIYYVAIYLKRGKKSRDCQGVEQLGGMQPNLCPYILKPCDLLPSTSLSVSQNNSNAGLFSGLISKVLAQRMVFKLTY
jgi:hypothetical protein